MLTIKIICKIKCVKMFLSLVFNDQNSIHTYFFFLFFFSCWMSLTAFYYSFAIPVGLIILCNLTVFVVTVISICRRPTGLRTNQSKSKMAMANLQAAITSFVLLGMCLFKYHLII